MSKDDNKPAAALFRGQLNAADLRWCYNVASNPNDEQVTDSLVKDNLGRHAGVRASEDDGERFLLVDGPELMRMIFR